MGVTTYPTPLTFLLIPPWTDAQESCTHMGYTVVLVSTRRIRCRLKRALTCSGTSTFHFYTHFCKITYSSALHFRPSLQPNHIFTNSNQICMGSLPTLELYSLYNHTFSLP